MNQIQLYFDEDAMHTRLVTALRSRGVTVITVMDAGLTAVSDEEQLAFATETWLCPVQLQYLRFRSTTPTVGQPG